MADCNGSNVAIYSDSLLALNVGTGSVAWIFKPIPPNNCDDDFGATPNAGLAHSGATSFLGAGAKNGAYYSVDPTTGTLRWQRRVVFGGSAGGFIGTTAYDGHRVYGSTALGDFGGPLCDPSNPHDKALQEPTVHSIEATDGAIAWQARNGASFGPTTTAGGLTFNGVALNPVVDVRIAATGHLLTQLPLRASCWSGIATVGDAVVLGTGSSFQGWPDGIVAFTPGGTPPR
jgi:outer membrane protein assembly factor BamB